MSQDENRESEMPAHPFDDDHLREECGVFGIFGHEDASALTALGLHALQHRGQEAAGIVSFDGTQFHNERHIGLVGDNFTKPAVIDRLNADGPVTKPGRPSPRFPGPTSCCTAAVSENSFWKAGGRNKENATTIRSDASEGSISNRCCRQRPRSEAPHPQPSSHP